jgi:hypothetical protein
LLGSEGRGGGNVALEGPVVVWFFSRRAGKK